MTFLVANKIWFEIQKPEFTGKISYLVDHESLAKSDKKTLSICLRGDMHCIDIQALGIKVINHYIVWLINHFIMWLIIEESLKF